eukprot:3601283-Pleurochrysis_carterae.AAC.1
MTSTSAERMFALGCDHDARAGASRDGTRSGAIFGKADGTEAFMRGRELGEVEWKRQRRVAWQGLKETMQAKRTKAGQELQTERRAKLDEKRAKRAARDAERARIDALPLAMRYSDLKLMGV